MLDLALTAALKEHLQKHEKVADAFFAITGPVGDLATKIDLALLAGLVGKTMYRDLVTIKDIRNYFAHKLNVSDFKSEAIRTLAANLKILRTRRETETSAHA
jgi:DNA-binding MltR family transcriptional regulator